MDESGEALGNAAEEGIPDITITPNMGRDEFEELLDQEKEAAETEELNDDKTEGEKEMGEKVSPMECLLHLEKVRAFCQMECFSNNSPRARGNRELVLVCAKDYGGKGPEAHHQLLQVKADQ